MDREASGRPPRTPGGRSRRDPPLERVVASGTATLAPDPDRPGAATLLLDGTPQSHVDSADPTWLAFDYVRRLGHLLDLAAPAGDALDVVHLGGGALTLPRYVATTRRGSRQRVFEIDGPLVEFVRQELPLPAGSGIRVGTADAREGLSRLRDASADVVVGDVFAGARTPAHLTSRELVAEVARVLRPGGLYALNVADGPPLAFARGQVATLASVFRHVLLVADPGVLRGRRFGNLVLAASDAPLPVADLTRRASGDPAMARVQSDLSEFSAGARPVTDESATPSPTPPPEVFSRR